MSALLITVPSSFLWSVSSMSPCLAPFTPRSPLGHSVIGFPATAFAATFQPTHGSLTFLPSGPRLPCSGSSADTRFGSLQSLEALQVYDSTFGAGCQALRSEKFTLGAAGAPKTTTGCAFSSRMHTQLEVSKSRKTRKTRFEARVPIRPLCNSRYPRTASEAMQRVLPLRPEHRSETPVSHLSPPRTSTRVTRCVAPPPNRDQANQGRSQCCRRRTAADHNPRTLRLRDLP